MKSNMTGLWKKSANVNHRQCWCGCRYLWLAIAKAVSRWTTETVFDAAKTHNASWRQLAASVVCASLGVVRRDKLSVGIGFHTRTLPTLTPTPGACVSLSHDLQRGSLPAYGLSDTPVDCCLPSIGHDYWEKYWANTNTTQYWQVLANTPIPLSFEPYSVPLALAFWPWLHTLVFIFCRDACTAKTRWR